MKILNFLRGIFGVLGGHGNAIQRIEDAIGTFVGGASSAVGRVEAKLDDLRTAVAPLLERRTELIALRTEIDAELSQADLLPHTRALLVKLQRVLALIP